MAFFEIVKTKLSDNLIKNCLAKKAKKGFYEPASWRRKSPNFYAVKNTGAISYLRNA